MYLGCLTNPTAKMFYQNFEHHITHMYRLTIEGWLLGKLCSPSSIISFAELEVLHNSWVTGTTRFRKLSNEEWTKFLRGTEHSGSIEGGNTQGDGDSVGGGGTEGDGTSTVRNNTPTPPDTAPDTAPTATHHTPSAPVVNDPVTTQMTLTAPILASITNHPTAKKRKAAPFTDFVNLMAVDGRPVGVQKKPRQKRSDAGLPRGPRKKKVVSSASTGDGSTAAGSASHQLGASSICIVSFPVQIFLTSIFILTLQ